MQEKTTRVIIVPETIAPKVSSVEQKRLRVAAYCRVSTEEEDQINSFEMQKSYYTERIMTNPRWLMVDIFADEGISGTQVKKRDEFKRMIKQCRQHKIDLILTKSVSRFARNTVECLQYIRALKELGVGVIFEKENINTLEIESELLLTFFSAFAQAESESISENVKWGIRKAMKNGSVGYAVSRLYGFEKGSDGQPQIVSEQAEVVRRIYTEYLSGETIPTIRKRLTEEGIPCTEKSPKWCDHRIYGILTNEKYCGDVLRQKTFVEDCIKKKSVKNTGQLPMYYIQNNHEGIVTREQFEAVKAEMARRNAQKPSSQKYTTTGMGKYSSKYALTGKMFCKECGKPYKRVTWTSGGTKEIVWRCSNRLDYGKKYCRQSPSLHESDLQNAILTGLNQMMSPKDNLIGCICETMSDSQSYDPADLQQIMEIEEKLRSLENEFQQLLGMATDTGKQEAHLHRFGEIADAMSELKTKRATIEKKRRESADNDHCLKQAADIMEQANCEINSWNEAVIRQAVETVEVISKDKIRITSTGGSSIQVYIHRQFK